MPILYDFIFVEGTPSTELTDEKQKQAAMDVAAKLEPVEEEILQHPQGKITIRSTGNVFVDGFPTELSRKIAETLS